MQVPLIVNLHTHSFPKYSLFSLKTAVIENLCSHSEQWYRPDPATDVIYWNQYKLEIPIGPDSWHGRNKMPILHLIFPPYAPHAKNLVHYQALSHDTNNLNLPNQHLAWALHGHLHGQIQPRSKPHDYAMLCLAVSTCVLMGRWHAHLKQLDQKHINWNE